MHKKYLFQSKPYSKELFIRGVGLGGTTLSSEELSPAGEEVVSAFEKSISCKLPDSYRDFLIHYNGGMIDPYKASRNIACDVIESANSTQNFGYKTIVVDYFYTLDRQSVDVLIENGVRSAEQFFLPTAYKEFQSMLNDDEDGNKYGFSEETVVPIADSAPFGLLICCTGKLKNKVLVMDFNSFADKPLDNIGVLANSFDEFMQKLYF